MIRLVFPRSFVRRLIVVMMAAQGTCIAQPGEVWISQGQARVGQSGDGTEGNPFLVPKDNARLFDRVIRQIPPRATVHLGPGVFQTEGTVSDASAGMLRAVSFPEGCRIRGCGVGQTIIRLKADALHEGQRGVVIDFVPSSPRSHLSSEVSDLTVDCNFGKQSLRSVKTVGINYSGFRTLIERVEIIQLGGRTGEAFGIIGGNFDAKDVDTESSVLIRDCHVHQPYTGPDAYLTGISPAGNNRWTGRVEDCVVDFSPARYPVSGAQGIAFAGSARKLKIRRNVVTGCTRGIHFDTPGQYPPANPVGVEMSDNRILQCSIGIAIGWPGESLSENIRYREFEITDNFIQNSGGIGVELSNRCSGFVVQNNEIESSAETPPDAYCVAISLDQLCEGNQITGNQYGPKNIGKQVPLKPASYAPDSGAALNNVFRKNGWIRPE